MHLEQGHGEFAGDFRTRQTTLLLTTAFYNRTQDSAMLWLHKTVASTPTGELFPITSVEELRVPIVNAGGTRWLRQLLAHTSTEIGREMRYKCAHFKSVITN